jgi:hypothetical protein
MSNINKILLAVVIVLLVALAAVLAWQFWFKTPTYYAVYLRTGDLYFGELTTFPYFGLKHVYMIQVNAQDKTNPVSLQKFTNIFWGPTDFMRINRNEVVWYTQLSPQSQLAQLIANNPNLMPTNANVPQPAPVSPGTTATSTTTNPAPSK